MNENVIETWQEENDESLERKQRFEKVKVKISYMCFKRMNEEPDDSSHWNLKRDFENGHLKCSLGLNF